MTKLTIEPADFKEPALIELIEFHQRDLQMLSRPENIFALNLSGLQTPEVELFVARLDGDVVGMVAIKDLQDGTAELKSMRVKDGYRGHGIGQQLLHHAIDFAKASSAEKLFLETGTHANFQSAVSLYERNGFTECEPFSDYQLSDESRFFTLTF